MKRFLAGMVAVVGLGALAGCTVNLPFNTRPSFSTVTQARGFDAKSEGPVKVAWLPSSFPDRVDIEGASGFVGGGSRTRIPTGPGLSSRILETLDAAVGVSASAPKTLTLTIKNAKTKFQYSAGIFNVTPAIDRASCDLDLGFALGAEQWTQTFHAEAKEGKVGGTSQTGLVEQVWDDIALQVTKDVVSHMRR
ncbi:MAG: hypothetical protein ABIU96_14250 [Rhodanobacter sp.]